MFWLNFVKDFNGLYDDPKEGWWLLSGGTVRWDYTGLYNDPSCGWWMVESGKVNKEFNGKVEL